MTLINNQDWNALKEKFQNADPFPSICINNFLNPDFALRLSKSYPDYSIAQTQGREFATVNEKSKVQITDSKQFPAPVAELHQALAGSEFIEAMQTMSGLDDLQFDHNFFGGGMHLTGTSGILDVHVDFNYSEQLQSYRRLNLLIYLNEDWKDEWGGNVELWNKDVSKCVHSLSPIHNRCVIFATSDSSFHGVTAVTSPPGVIRKSFAIYLYNKENSGSKYGESHSTIFKARPNEKLKKYYLMPLEAQWNKLTGTLDHTKKAIKKIIGR